jgi:hypothetical protein
VETIRQAPRQEIGTHTFSHYYCLEPGQERSHFGADLSAACAIANRFGVELRSIAFPRNQENPAYRQVLLDHGITTYRGNPAWPWRAATTRGNRAALVRAARLGDAYVGVTAAVPLRWHEVVQRDGLANVRATGFLRPFNPRIPALEELRLRRIVAGIERAARERTITHLWWHPSNFAVHTDRCIAFLRRILIAVTRCRTAFGMLSLTMDGAARMARDLQPQYAAL